MDKLSSAFHLSKADVIKSGSVYTSPTFAKLIFKMSKPYITEKTVIGDIGAGYGAFIDVFKKLDNRCFGTECDKISFDFLCQKFNNVDLYFENSLSKIDRKKYNLKDTDELFIVGNPPYNDTTSIYQKGKKGELICDEDVKSRDFGISFLKAYCLLDAKYICVLHPLAYLIKKQNFTSLGIFKDNYILKKAIIFSSLEFETIKKTNSEFPVVAALYEKSASGMDFSYINNFGFNILNTRKMFKLSKFKTIDGEVLKYPQSKKEGNLQFYTLRDMNALLRNKAFIKGNIKNGVEVYLDDLYKYCWLFFLKENFNPPKNRFLYGNLSPLYPKKVTTKHFKNAVVSYAYKNSKVLQECFSKEIIEKKYGILCEDLDILYTELKKIYY